MLAIATTFFLVSTSFGVNVQANEFEDTKKGQFTDKFNDQEILTDLTPVDNEISPYAQIIDLPGPIKNAGWIPNHKLIELIQVREKQGNQLGWLTLGLGRVPGASFAVDATTASMLISGDPIDRMKQAYWTGEDMYVGQYYSTPKPGLTTIPFIIYTKERLQFVSPPY